jgi:hypothetical protein
MKLINKFPFHSLLIPIYAVLSLWVANINQTAFYTAIKPLVITLILGIILFCLALLISRSLIKAGLLTSLIELLFLYYGHVYDLFKGLKIDGFLIGRNLYLLAIWMLILIIGVILLLRSKQNLSKVNLYGNYFSLLLTVFALFQIANYELHLPPVQNVVEENPHNSSQTFSTSRKGTDIYYIILDGYERQDAMLEDIHYDNSEFIAQLENLGFVVPDCTQSNYDSTMFSVASALNMNYLDKLDIPWKTDATTYQVDDFIGPIRDNLVRQTLETQGYQFVTFKSNFRFIDIKDSDIYYDREANVPFYEKLESENFYYLFLRTTLLRSFIGSDKVNLSFLPNWAARLIDPKASEFSTEIYKKYEEDTFDLQKLTEIPSLPGDQFVYAHLLITHRPFVFNPDGTFRNSRGEGLEAYRDQVEFIDQEMIRVIKAIIDRSDNPPIIILQGDHGYVGGLGQNRVLNAYFLPNGGKELVYPTITPINSFRLILSNYFGMDYSLIEDKSYYTGNSDTPYLLSDAPESCISH